MRKFYFNLGSGAIVALVTYCIFFYFQISFAQDIDKGLQVIVDTTKNKLTLENNNEIISSMNEKIEFMKLYVFESQKNLDSWLKLLVFILSLLIGYSIFTGLKARELAKQELSEIWRIKEDIKLVAKDVEDRLRYVKEQITLIEKTALSAKSIESQMAEQLNDIGIKADLELNSIQKKVIDEVILKTKDDLQKSGIDAFKNLYYAKALKAGSISNWDESLRLWNTFIDLDDNNSISYFQRGLAYSNIGRYDKENITLLDKALVDYNEALRLEYHKPESIFNNIGVVYRVKREFESAIEYFDKGIKIRLNKVNEGKQTSEMHDLAQLYLNRGIAHRSMKNFESALSDINKSMSLRENYGNAYYSRGLTYKMMDKMKEADVDFAIAKEIGYEVKQT